MGEKGITLIEMMITAVIVVTLAAAGYTFFENTTKFQARQERMKDMQIRLQGAMDLLVHDIRHAGYGIIDPLSAPTEVFPAAIAAGLNTPITPGNNIGVFDADGNIVIRGGPDTLGILRIGQTPLGTLDSAMEENTATMQVAVVDEIASQGNDLAALQGSLGLITLGGLFTQPLAPGGNSIQNQPRNALGEPVMQFTLNEATGSNQRFPVGFPVEAIVGGGVVYSIGRHADGQGLQTNLLQNGALFAPGIEDMQVAYLLADGRVVNNPGVAPYSAIRVSLTAYVPDPDPTWRGVPRPALEDHAAEIQRDNFHRSTLTRIVELNNDGF